MGAKTVCAQYKDAEGNVSATATDSIVLDTIAPAIQDAGVQSGTAGANDWYVSAVVNRFTASDTAARVSAPPARRASRRTSRLGRMKAPG